MLAGGHRKAASGLQHAAANVEGSHHILALPDVEVKEKEFRPRSFKITNTILENMAQ